MYKPVQSTFPDHQLQSAHEVMLFILSSLIINKLRYSHFANAFVLTHLPSS